VATVSSCLPRQEFHKNRIFQLQKTVAVIFPDDYTLLNFFFFLGEVVCCHSIDCHLDLCWEWWTQVSSVMTVLMGSHHLQYYTNSKINYGCFPCLVFICQRLWLAQTLEEPSSSVSAITLRLLIDRSEHNSSVVVQNSSPIISSTYWILFSITAVEGLPLHDLLWNVSDFLCLLIHHAQQWTVLRSKFASTHTLSRSLWIQISFSP